jgi:uncharacterized protein
MFSDEDFDVLNAWLSRRPTGMRDIITLEGFLTAIIIGPNTLSPATWLPKVWGGRSPRFASEGEFQAFLDLVLRFHNDLVGWFERDPAEFEPTFYVRGEGRDAVVIVDEWCEGFVRGVALDKEGWRPLKRAHPELLKPMQLFGTNGGWLELEMGDELALHAQWSPRIAPAVRSIHAYWLSHRDRVRGATRVPENQLN